MAATQVATSFEDVYGTPFDVVVREWEVFVLGYGALSQVTTWK